MKQKNRKQSLLFETLAIALLATVLMAYHQQKAPAPTQQTADRPNVLVILTDDQGYGDIGYNNSAGDLQTPHLDRMAQSGVKLTQCRANSSVCSPSRAALLSGRYPDLAGVPGVIRDYSFGRMGYLNPNTSLFPRQFQEAGYQTGMVGKWHLGLESPNLPNDRGFGWFKGWLSGMMHDYWEHEQRGVNYLRHNKKPIRAEGHATNVFTRWAIEYLDQAQKSEKPFFLYLAYTAPHSPIQPPKDWLEKVMKRQPQLDSSRAKIVALIEHLDHNIGQVYQHLENQNMLENTLIIFASDNGGKLKYQANNQPFRGGKADMYEGGLRVPAFVTWKGHLKAGTQCQAPITGMDLLPTACQWAGIEPPKGPLNGQSFAAEINGDSTAQAHSRELFFMRRESFATGAKLNECVIRKEWKLVQNDPFGPKELFNLRQDPEETQNLIEEKPKIAKKLRNRLIMHHIEAGRIPWREPLDSKD